MYKKIRYIFTVYLSGLCMLYGHAPARQEASPPPDRLQSLDTLFSKVISASGGIALSGATVRVGDQQVQTDTAGNFSVPFRAETDRILVNYLGYKEFEGAIAEVLRLGRIILEEQDNVIEDVEVYSTGYFQLPKERATGSFTHIGSELMARSPQANIIDRLEGVTSSLQFTRKDSYNESGGEAKLRVRGLSSINAEVAPLIILDDFPFEGELSSINPENIESITVLKDAAASSIWGARAGNGVIVINSKKGKFNSTMQVDFSTRWQIAHRPDLFDDKARLPSRAVLEIEDRLFAEGIYARQDQLALPYYVDLKYQLEDGLITQDQFDTERSRLANSDIRRDAMKYLYRNAAQNLSNVSLRGGSEIHHYNLSAAWTSSSSAVRGDGEERLSLDISNGIKLWRGGTFSIVGSFSDNKARKNGISLSQLYTSGVGKVSTYSTLIGEDGGYAPLVRDYSWTFVNKAEEDGLLDWRFVPLQERELNSHFRNNRFLRISPQFSFSFLSAFKATVLYQYQHTLSGGRNHYGKDSYFVRDMVNSFTQTDGTRIIPHNDIFNYSERASLSAQSGRVQLSYDRSWGNHSELYILAGGERRERIYTTQPAQWVYNYDPDLRTGSGQFDFTELYPQRPSGSARITGSALGGQKNVDRDISYYTNLSYTYLRRFTLTNSMRWDASNLFGVKTNQRGVPLWSIGGAWNIDREAFAEHLPFDMLKLRATYGVSGNVNKSLSSLPTIRYGTNVETQLPMATLTAVGNPSLRWEKVKTWNIGVDLSMGNVLKVSVDYYVKNGEDLFGMDYVDPTTGISGALQQMVNYADLRTDGLDFDLTFAHQFSGVRWTSNLLASYVSNRITDYRTNDNLKANAYLLTTGAAPPVKGRSVDALYALPWNGLSPINGLPIIYVDGEQSSDYANYINNFPVQGLEKVGVTVPRFHSFFRTTLSYKNIDIGGMLSFKGGHRFRRSSMMPGGEYLGNDQHHMDYYERWKKPGDETRTVIPAATDSYSSQLAMSYGYSRALIEPADHIRIEDLTAAYTAKLAKEKLKVKVVLMLRNVGILWQKSDSGLDPEMPFATYRRPKEFSLGIQLQY
ncbi:SusC/RagA family TonB-linked outer membrane protein [Sphingobacterium suaedae]|uniref:SusC/RagA family TonB-linked outer membrane protein n=1 Tax=Sphingobacterium suaedae TaxID=1686402 RepID=A0ABW5KJ02_9SPHI